MSSVTPHRNSVILFVGPDRTGSFDYNAPEARTAFDKHGVRYTIIGDGRKDCTETMIADGIRDHSKGWTGEDVTVIVTAHGNEEWGEHTLQLDCNQTSLPTEEFVQKYLIGDPCNGSLTKSLKCLLRERGRAESLDASSTYADGTNVTLPKIDVFLASCCAGRALRHAGLLPKGSTMVAASDGYSWCADPAYLFRRLGQGSGVGGNQSDLSARSLLDEHFLTAGKIRGYPLSYATSTTVSGQRASFDLHQPHEKFLQRVGEPFKSEEQRSAQAKWGDIVGSEKLESLMTTIGESKSQGKVKSPDYLLALAICEAFPAASVRGSRATTSR